MADLRPAPHNPWRCSILLPSIQFGFACLLSTRLRTRAQLLALLLLTVGCLNITACPLQHQNFSFPSHRARHHVHVSITNPKFDTSLAFVLSFVSLPHFLLNPVVHKSSHSDSPLSKSIEINGNQNYTPRVDHTDDRRLKSNQNNAANNTTVGIASEKSNSTATEVSDKGQAHSKYNSANNSRLPSDFDLESEGDSATASTSNTLLAGLRENARGQRLTSGGFIELIEWLFVFILVAPGTFPAIGCVLYACTSFARRRFFASFLETTSSIPSSNHISVSVNSATVPTAHPRPSRVPLQRLPSNSNAVNTKPATRTNSPSTLDPPNSFVSMPANFASRSRSRSPMLETPSAV